MADAWIRAGDTGPTLLLTRGAPCGRTRWGR